MPVPRIRAHPTLARRLLLGTILLVAFALRVTNLNWDEGTHQHPDERYWSIVTDDIAWPGFVDYFDGADSPLNPYTDRSTWVYGTAPLFATKAVASFLHDGPFPAGAFVTTADALGIELRTDGTGSDGRPARVDAFDARYNANLVGRLLAALIDTGTVALVYLLGTRLFDRRVGMVAALLLAFTVLHIQYAHFHGAEPWVTFFVTAAVLASTRIAEGDLRLRTAAGVGALMGLAIASKLIAAAALVVPATALAISAGPDVVVLLRQGVRRLTVGDEPAEPEGFRRRVRRAIAGVGAGITVLAAAAVVFRVLQPYAFDGLFSLDERFRADLRYLEGVNRGGAVPWVIQWVGRTPLWYPLQSAFWWGLGPALGTAVVAGMVVSARDIVRHRRWTLLLPLVLIAVMSGLVATQFNPLIRYLLPAYPIAVTLGAAAVVRAWDRSRAVGVTVARARVLHSFAALTVAGTCFWGLAFVNGVHGETHTRIEASRWMAANLPPDAVISAQLWDDSLPLSVQGTAGFAPTLVTFDLFGPDSAIDPESGRPKTEELIADLDQVDYIVEASNRLYDSIPRIPAKYPATVAYYDALFDGRLGFDRVATFRNDPSLFGITIPTGDAEETFTVYDHPTVTIWAKTPRFSVENARAILNPTRAALARDIEPAAAATNMVMLPPDRLAAQQAGETFSDAFDDDGAVAAAPWLFWFLWLQIAAFAVLPWTTRLLRPLPDHGYGLTKVIGFVVVGGLSWITTAWGIADGGRALAWFWMAIIASAGASGSYHQRGRLLGLFRSARGSWIAAEIVFCAVFALALWMRSANPDLWEAYLGGEKPMELAYLTAIGRSTSLPAVDPWFGGGAMNYYYLGWYLLTVPMRALRILPEVAFQLGVATYAALTAVTAFSLVHNLVAISARRGARGAIRTGVLGVVLLMGVGNIDAVRQQLERLETVNTWKTGSGIPVLGTVISTVGGTWAWITGTPLPRFDWWAPSRVNDGTFDITEFPYFTFLFGDLHPHMMGMVFIGLAASVALALLVAARSGDRRRGALLAVVLGVVTGLTRMVNTWDLPTVAILSVGAIVVGQLVAPKRQPTARTTATAALGTAVGLAAGGAVVGASTSGGLGGTVVSASGALGLLCLLALVWNGQGRERILQVAGQGALLGGTHLIVTWPFLRFNEAFDTGIGDAADFTPLDDYAAHWGIFVTFAAAFSAAMAVDARRRAVAERIDVVAAHGRRGEPATALVVTGAVALVVGIIGLASTLVTAVFAVGVLGALVMLTIGIVELRRDDPDLGRVMVAGMFALAFAVSSGVDLVTLENDISRMNTVFKFWLQAWQLFALAGAAAVWQVGRVLGADPVQPNRAESPARPRLQMMWAGVVAVALVAGFAYPVLATRTRLETRFAALPVTLDGLAYLDIDPVIVRRDGETAPEVTVRLADDLPLIEWLRDNVRGTPTIAEWTGAAYDWNARMAIHTGLPSVLGWEWHQRQQRWSFQWMIDERRDATQRFFTTADAAEMTRYLQAYDVAYVIVGTQEHRFGTPEALNTVATHPALVEVFSTDAGSIYEVDDELLWGQEPSASPAPA